MKGGISRRQRRCLYFGAFCVDCVVFLWDSAFVFFLHKVKTGRGKGNYEMDRDVVSSLRMRQKKDAPNGRLICREMTDRHHLGESLKELYKRNPCCAIHCTQTPNGTSSYHCEIEEELTEKYLVKSSRIFGRG